MKLSDIKTLQEVALEYEIPVPTLKTRLTLKSFNLINGEDYRRMGKGQGIILSPEGVKKIVSEKEKYKKCRTCVNTINVSMELVEVTENCPNKIKFSSMFAVNKKVCEGCKSFKDL